MERLAQIIPFIPLAGFLLIGLSAGALSKKASAWIASGSILLAFFFTVPLFFHIQQTQLAIEVKLFDWIKTGPFDAGVAFLVDELSVLFMLVITGIGFLIHLFSVGYMKDDPGFRRYLSFLNFFIFFMLLLVMGNNLLVTFIGWEGVGLCSFMLIGFWYKEHANNEAAKKAFVMNRIGDLGFLIGIFIIYLYFGTLDFTKFLNVDTITASGISAGMITILTLCLFIGATGKSAQIPLFTWLPDAMAGPTPVSALIHAATMVTAGIYLVARTNILFSMSPDTLQVVIWIGIATSLIASIIGIYQNDIKKVLAYSTVSQLGLMFVALGLGAYTAAVFHVITHAVFKALLFLGSGSVIHAMSGEQDIRKMGGLSKVLPITHITFLIGTLAIAGIPPLAGFFSKDEILAAAFEGKIIVWILAVAVSLMTAFYMFRLYFLTFKGKFRGTEEQKAHLHESPLNMTVPLMILAGLSIVAGWIGFPHVLGKELGIHHGLSHFLEPILGGHESHLNLSTELGLMGMVTGLVILVIWFCYNRFVKKSYIPASDENASESGFTEWAGKKFYVDELYEMLFLRPFNKLGVLFDQFIEHKLIDGIVRGIGQSVTWGGGRIRFIQNGNIGFYLLVFVIALALMLILISL
jgi:NADH-quinone oxidoreductase subunit L